MKLANNNSSVFCADIDVSFFDDEIAIQSVDHIISLIQNALVANKISCALHRNIITGGNAKPICELSVSDKIGRKHIIETIQTVLNEANIDWYEPYSEDSDEFRFILPAISVFHC